MKSKTLQLLPSRAKLLIESELPRWVEPITEVLSTEPNTAAPDTESAELSREKLRTLMELPMKPKSRIEIALPNRPKLRMESDDPRFKKSTTLVLLLMRALPVEMLMEDPMRNADRSDIVEPRAKKSSTDAFLPSRAKFLMLKELPRLAKFSVDNLSPNFACPAIDMVDPMRPVHLRLTEEPRARKSSTETLEPNRAKFLMEKLLPRARKSHTETLPPNRAKLRVLIELPSERKSTTDMPCALVTPCTETEDPRRPADRRDKLLPK
jgi:hypothetical protein